MRIEITVPRLAARDGIVGGVCLLWLLVSLLGYAMTQRMSPAAPLTRGRWQELRIQRQTRHDLQRLAQDLAQLEALSRQSHPDPVPALALAQRIYHRHRTGAVTTVAARQALIRAAETAVQVAYGAREASQLEAALRTAEEQRARLQSP